MVVKFGINREDKPLASAIAEAKKLPFRIDEYDLENDRLHMTVYVSTYEDLGKLTQIVNVLRDE